MRCSNEAQVPSRFLPESGRATLSQLSSLRGARFCVRCSRLKFFPVRAPALLCRPPRILVAQFLRAFDRSLLVALLSLGVSRLAIVLVKIWPWISSVSHKYHTIPRVNLHSSPQFVVTGPVEPRIGHLTYTLKNIFLDAFLLHRCYRTTRGGQPAGMRGSPQQLGNASSSHDPPDQTRYERNRSEKH